MFTKGQSGNPEGRKKGSHNSLTKTVKERVLEAFEAIQEHPTANLITWGTANPHLFYPIAAKLIPTEVNANVTGKIFTVVSSMPKKQLPSKTGTLTGGES